jgi:hypothetical protein
MTETKYWQALRKKIKDRLAYVWKINANYEAGVPDWYASDKQDWWVENKRIKNDAKNPQPIMDLTDHRYYLSANQQLWLQRRFDEGRNVGVIVFGQPGHIWLPGLEFETPVPREEYLERAMNMNELADFMVALISGQS